MDFECQASEAGVCTEENHYTSDSLPRTAHFKMLY